MGRNVEIKARAHDSKRQSELAAEICGSEPEEIRQEDYFYRSNTGRLKLRLFPHHGGELIAYRRADERRPRESRYEIFPVEDGKRLAAVLSEALEVVGVVRKSRLLFRLGRTRIHFDHVEQLGQFIEIEVVLQPGETIDEGERIAQDLIDRLGIDSADLVDRAYIDLLAAATEGQP